MGNSLETLTIATVIIKMVIEKVMREKEMGFEEAKEFVLDSLRSAINTVKF